LLEPVKIEISPQIRPASPIRADDPVLQGLLRTFLEDRWDGFSKTKWYRIANFNRCLILLECVSGKAKCSFSLRQISLILLERFCVLNFSVLRSTDRDYTSKAKKDPRSNLTDLSIKDMNAREI
jgi:hypothetical protein